MGETPTLTEPSPASSGSSPPMEAPSRDGVFPVAPDFTRSSPFINYEKPLEPSQYPADARLDTASLTPPLEWDSSAMKPVPEFMADAPSAEAPVLAEPLPEAHVTPITVTESLSPEVMPVYTPEPAPVEATIKEPEPAAEFPVLLDQSGQQWKHVGQTESGMHKLESPDGMRMNMVSPATFEQQYKSAAEAPEEPAETPVSSSSEQVQDPEKVVMQQQISMLEGKIKELEDRLVRLEKEKISAETGELPALEVGDTVPIFSWAAKDYQPAMITEKAERNGESYYKVILEGETEPMTVFADEVDYWRTRAAKREEVPQTQEEAKRRFSGRFSFVKKRLDAYKNRSKEALSVPLTMAQVAAETVAPHLEKANSYRRRLIGQALGSAVMFRAREFVWPDDTNETGRFDISRAKTSEGWKRLDVEPQAT